MRASAIQFTIKPGETDANLNHVRAALGRIADRGGKLAVLPEMWSSGFSYKNLNALATRTGEVVAELETLSRNLGLVIVGSMPEPDGGQGL